MINFKNYDHDLYPLRRYVYQQIPMQVFDLINALNNQLDICVRGGLAYILQTKQFDYELKDIDIFAKQSEEQSLLTFLQQIDGTVFVNQNMSQKKVITIFIGKSIYYKVDVLLVDDLRHYSHITVKETDRPLRVSCIEYIWSNKLQKIAEKSLRQHTDEKTLNHYRIVCALTPLIDPVVLAEQGVNEHLVNVACAVLDCLVKENELNTFHRQINQLIKRE